MKFRRIAAGDYETEDGRFRLYRLVDVSPPAWNVEEIGNDVLPVDAAATKRDALALFADFLAEQAADAVIAFLRAISKIRGDVGPEAIILSHGKIWSNEEPPRKHLPNGERRSCFKNALDVALSDRDLSYVEGYIASSDVPFPIHHAWTVDSAGRVYDTTPIPRADAYVGVAFTFEFVAREALRLKASGPYLDFTWPYKREEIPDGVFADVEGGAEIPLAPVEETFEPDPDDREYADALREAAVDNGLAAS